MLNLLSFACLCLQLFFKPGPGFSPFNVSFSHSARRHVWLRPHLDPSHTNIYLASSTFLQHWSELENIPVFVHMNTRLCCRGAAAGLSHRRLWAANGGCGRNVRLQLVSVHNSENENLVHPSSTHVQGTAKVSLLLHLAVGTCRTTLATHFIIKYWTNAGKPPYSTHLMLKFGYLLGHVTFCINSRQMANCCHVYANITWPDLWPELRLLSEGSCDSFIHVCLKR